MLENSSIEVSEKDFPYQSSIEDKSRFLLKYAALAPSTFNTQPWKFSIQGSVVIFYPNYDHWLKISDPEQRELFISLGCALENYLIAANYFGMAYSYHVTKDAIIIRMQDQRFFVSNKDLFHSITQRSTNKGLFKNNRPHPVFLMKLKQSLPEGVFVSFFSSEEIKRPVRSLSLEADFNRFFLCSEYKDELTYWLKKRYDELIANFTLDIALIFSNRRKEIRDPLHNAPIYGILFAEKDDLASRIRVGQALERIYLLSHIEGLQICPMSNILEVAQTKLKLEEMFQEYRKIIMQPFCLGYPIGSSKIIPRLQLDFEKPLV